MHRLNFGFERVALARAPIDLALAQLRFDPDAFDVEEVSDRLPDALAGRFEGRQAGRADEMLIHVGPPGLELRQAASHYVTLDSPNHEWKLRLAPGAATLFTASYTKREDFEQQLVDLRTALARLGVTAFRRVGVRFVARCEESEVLDEMPAFLAPHLHAGLGLPPIEDLPEGAGIVHSLADVLLQLDGSSVARVRAGAAAPGTSPDPALAPSGGTALLVDVDVYDETHRNNDETIDDILRTCAHNQYQLFRWAVTDRFLEYFGRAA